jgi:hypothetical protein
MAVKKQLKAKAGTYTNKQGEEKTRYVNVGVLLETSKGEMLKIESLPVFFDGWIYFADLEKRDIGDNPTKASVANLDNSDVPF